MGPQSQHAQHQGCAWAGRGIPGKQGLPAQPSAAADSAVPPTLTAATTTDIYIFFFFLNPCRENKRPEKRNTRKALVSYLGRVQLSSVRAEEEGAEEHYLKQKWRQNPPVRSILLPPPPPPAPLPHRGRREPSGVPATRGSRHRASPAQVGKRPFFTKKIKEAERKLPQLFLLAGSRRGARPKSLGREKSTHKGLLRAGRRGRKGQRREAGGGGV